MAEDESVEGLEDRLIVLEDALGGAARMTAAFGEELMRIRASALEAGRDVRVLEGGISRGLSRAFEGLVFDGMRLSDSLRTVARSMADAAYKAALRPVAGHFGGLLAAGVGAAMNGLLPFEKGASFSAGRVRPFASGGIVSGPVRFPMRGGTGLMGEAGPEAILPLARGADGRLGVEARGGGGGRPVQVVVNVSTPDVEGFRRSRSQIAAGIGRALQGGMRNR